MWASVEEHWQPHLPTSLPRLQVRGCMGEWGEGLGIALIAGELGLVG